MCLFINVEMFSKAIKSRLSNDEKYRVSDFFFKLASLLAAISETSYERGVGGKSRDEGRKKK